MTDMTTAHLCAPAPRPARTRPLLGMFALWRQRRSLAKLSAEQLADIGVTARDADTEAARPMWDVPSHWRG